MKSNKIIPILLSLLIIGIVGVGLWRKTKDDGISNKSPIEIGVIYSLTGPASFWAENGREAAQMAVDEINATGGVNNHSLKLVIQDSQTSPSGSVNAFHKLVDGNGTKILIGDMWSFVTNPLIPLADQSKTLLVSPTVMDASVEGKSPYFFTVGHTVESQEDAVKRFFTSNHSIKTLYNLCENDAWGKAHTAMIHQIANGLGIKIIGETCTSDLADDYRTEALKIKTAKPDAIFLTAIYEDVAIKALYNSGVAAKILTTSGIVEAVKARSFPVEYTKNVWFMYWSPDNKFIQNFQEKYGSYPIMEAQNSYEAIRSIAAGLKNNPGNIQAGMKSVKYQSTDGEMDFTGPDNITVNKAQAKLYQFDSSGNFLEIK